MKDVYDYLRRMFMTVLLCPVAAAFWLAFGLSGFSPDRLMHFLGTLGQRYAAMDAVGQSSFLLQVLFGWVVLAFVFMLISFVVSPPRFRYILRKKGDKAVVSIVQ